MRTIKRSVLHISKWLGVFGLFRFLTRRCLRILCYHGLAATDEVDFRPKLFINAELFEKRLQFLVRHKYPVLSLDQALRHLQSGSLPHCATVVTVDDGFDSFFRHAWPILRRHSCPATVYVYSDACLTQEPVFRLIVQYMFWKTGNSELDLAGLGLQHTGTVSLCNGKVAGLIWDLIRLGETELDASGRERMARVLGERLGVDYEQIRSRRSFTIMSPDQLREVSVGGMVDVQLHTHHHRFPVEPGAAEREITMNKQALEPILGKSLVHFCYPSGVWCKDHWPVLQQLGIESAVTCDAGLISRKTPFLALNRFLDANDMSEIEFAAEMAGFSDLLRKLKSLIWLKNTAREN